MRDAGLLESVLFRPRTGYYADLIEEAVAFWESLGQKHTFVDGNKRIGFAATYILLAINSVTVRASAEEAYAFISGRYEAGSSRLEVLTKWLLANSGEP